ncbi:hypothetical protein DSO57_1029145 [Entomophthora muscae]|uniref:Uncharacterized protein n=1 Tax=Entomophthora muscae TaxID=34485 RepID=A0ACC2UAX7_9FUNG|nr:hypothetical protein DSO57_1029145 [Entomophthora muscae]
MEEESREIPYSASLPKTPSLENTKKFILKNIELWKIYGKVTRSIYSVRSRQGYSALKLQSHIQHLFETLQDWYTALFRDWAQLKDAENSPKNECYNFGLTLKLNYLSLIILLYRPLLPRPGSPINPFAQAYYEKCKSAAIEITNLTCAHPDAFIDLAAPFKFYPVLISFSIHLLGSSVSIADANLRASSKQHVVNYLTVMSRFYGSSPLCGKVIFGSFNVLVSSNIIPAGFIDPQWPDSLKQVAKIYFDLLSKEAVAKNRAQSSPSNKVPSPTLASQQPHFMNPTQFLQAQVFGKQSKMSSPNEQKTFTTQSDSIRPPEKNIQPIPNNPLNVFDTSHNNLLNSHQNQMFQNQNPNTLPSSASFVQQAQPQMVAPCEPTSEQMVSHQMMLYNNLLQSQNGSRMMSFPNGQMSIPAYSAQMNPFPFPNNQLVSGNQAFGQSIDDFMWDPLYNFDFSGFNNGM